MTDSTTTNTLHSDISELPSPTLHALALSATAGLAQAKPPSPLPNKQPVIFTSKSESLSKNNIGSNNKIRKKLRFADVDSYQRMFQTLCFFLLFCYYSKCVQKGWLFIVFCIKKCVSNSFNVISPAFFKSHTNIFLVNNGTNFTCFVRQTLL